MDAEDSGPPLAVYVRMNAQQRTKLGLLVEEEARQSGMRRSANRVMLRLIEAAEIEALTCAVPHEAVPAVAGSDGHPTAAGGSVRVRVRMSAAIKEKADRLARERGFTPWEWLSGLVQSAVLADPVFDRRSVAALEGSIRELAHVGRNLNQIAHAMNKFPDQGYRPESDDIRAVVKCVESMKADVQRLVKATHRAWGLREKT